MHQPLIWGCSYLKDDLEVINNNKPSAEEVDLPCNGNFLLLDNCITIRYCYACFTNYPSSHCRCYLWATARIPWHPLDFWI